MFFTYLLMIELEFSSNKELRYMHMHISKIGLKGTSFPRMA